MIRTSSPNGRPTTLPYMLGEVVVFLDVGDRAVTELGRIKGIDFTPGKGVQDDIRALALWFERHPRLSRWIYRRVFR